MKRAYRTPKAKLIDFVYDEQVVASSGNVATYGDPQEIGRCQQSSPVTCMAFWDSNYPGKCTHTPFSLRDIV